MRRLDVGGVALPVVVAVLVAFALFFGHGPSDARLFWVGSAALVVVVVGWVVRPARLTGAGVAFFALLALFVLWQAISIHWSIQPSGSWDYANRGLVYLAFALAGALAAGAPRERLAEGFAALLGVLFVVALVGKVIPFYGGYARVARLDWPLLYWNELALLAAGAVPLALWSSARRRVWGSLLLYLALVTVVLTFSRFGIILAALAAISWVVIDRERLESASVVAVVAPIAGIVAGIGLALHGVGSTASHSVRLRDGLIFGGLVIVGGLGVALASRWRPELRLRRLLALGGAVVVVCVCVAALIVLVVRAGGPVAFVQARWHEFTQAAGVQSLGHLGSASSGNRWMWWQQAWRAFVHHPGGGTGAGTFALTSTVDAHNSLQTTIEPHNTPLQFLSETGIVGFLLYAGVIAAVAFALARRRDRVTVALALFALVAVVHSIVDIDWDFVATQGPLFALAGALVALPGVGRARLLPAAATAVVCLAAFYSLFAPWWSNRRYNAALSASTPSAMLAMVKEAHSLNPLALEPLYLLAGLEGKVHWVNEAVRLEPTNPDTWYALAEFYGEQSEWRAAYAAASHSYQLDAFGPAGQPGNVGILAACRLHLRTAGCT
jgi:hypothetical protein